MSYIMQSSVRYNTIIIMYKISDSKSTKKIIKFLGKAYKNHINIRKFGFSNCRHYSLTANFFGITLTLYTLTKVKSGKMTDN